MICAIHRHRLNCTNGVLDCAEHNLGIYRCGATGMHIRSAVLSWRMRQCWEATRAPWQCQTAWAGTNECQPCSMDRGPMERRLRMRLQWGRLYEETGDAGRVCRRCGTSRPTLRKMRCRSSSLTKCRSALTVWTSEGSTKEGIYAAY
jgi:hypothetical protein